MWSSSSVSSRGAWRGAAGASDAMDAPATAAPALVVCAASAGNALPGELRIYLNGRGSPRSRLESADLQTVDAEPC